jgi:hypothetical protein
MMHSLLAGMHGEFIGVRDDVKRVLGNLNALQSMLERSYNALEGRLGRIQEEEDVSIMGPTKALRKFHHDLMSELERQRVMLAGMTDSVIKKSDGDLAALLKESGDFKSLVKKIKAAPGTDKFSEKLAAVLSGVRATAEATNEVEKALKKLGVSRDEYAKLKQPKDLKKFISGHIASKLDADENTLRDYMKAAKVIYGHQYMHDDLVKSLGGRRGGLDNTEEDSTPVETDAESEGVSGGASAVSGGLKLDKRVRRREELRRDLLRTFNQRVMGFYNDMANSIGAIATAVGAKRVDLSDAMENFIRAVDILPDISNRYTYFALTGYFDDVRAKEERERYISSAKYLYDVADALSKKSEFSSIKAFGDLKRSLQALIDLVSKYYKRFSEGFGVMEAGIKGSDESSVSGSADMKALVKKAAKKLEDKLHDPEVQAKLKKIGKQLAKKAEAALDKKMGSDENDEPVSGGKLGESEIVYGEPFKMTQLNRTAYDFNKAKESLIYDFRTAKIRSNLTKLPAERKSFTEDYTKIVADSIASAVDKINTDREAFNKSVEKTILCQGLGVVHASNGQLKL